MESSSRRNKEYADDDELNYYPGTAASGSFPSSSSSSLTRHDSVGGDGGGCCCRTSSSSSEEEEERKMPPAARSHQQLSSVTATFAAADQPQPHTHQSQPSQGQLGEGQQGQGHHHLSYSSPAATTTSSNNSDNTSSSSSSTTTTTPGQQRRRRNKNKRPFKKMIASLFNNSNNNNGRKVVEENANNASNSYYKASTSTSTGNSCWNDSITMPQESDSDDDDDDEDDINDNNRRKVLSYCTKNIPIEERHALDEAMSYVPDLVKRESDPALYLQISTDITEAAERLCSYWNQRKQIFGPERFMKPVYTLSGNGALADSDIELLETCFFVYAPNTVNGLKVLIFDYDDRPSPLLHGPQAGLRRMRCLFYLLQHASMDESTRHQPLLLIRCFFTTKWEENRANRIQKLYWSMPIIMNTWVSIFAPAKGGTRLFKNTIVPLYKQFIHGLFNRYWGYRCYLGNTPEYFANKLIKIHGCTKEGLPPKLGGTWDESEYLTWLRQRRDLDIRKEEVEVVGGGGCSAPPSQEPQRPLLLCRQQDDEKDNANSTDAMDEDVDEDNTTQQPLQIAIGEEMDKDSERQKEDLLWENIDDNDLCKKKEEKMLVSLALLNYNNKQNAAASSASSNSIPAAAAVAVMPPVTPPRAVESGTAVDLMELCSRLASSSQQQQQQHNNNVVPDPLLPFRYQQKKEVAAEAATAAATTPRELPLDSINNILHPFIISQQQATTGPSNSASIQHQPLTMLPHQNEPAASGHDVLQKQTNKSPTEQITAGYSSSSEQADYNLLLQQHQLQDQIGVQSAMHQLHEMMRSPTGQTTTCNLLGQHKQVQQQSQGQPTIHSDEQAAIPSLLLQQHMAQTQDQSQAQVLPPCFDQQIPISGSMAVGYAPAATVSEQEDCRKPAAVADKARSSAVAEGETMLATSAPPRKEATSRKKTIKKPRKKPGKKPKKNKFPDDKPKRPLSAYNLFFKDERAKLLAGVYSREEGKASGEVDDVTVEIGSPVKNSTGFAAMAKTISAKWKQIDPGRLADYQAMAVREKERYTREMEGYKKMKQHGLERSRLLLESTVDEETREQYLLSCGNSHLPPAKRKKSNNNNN